jgi:hypothetical protein
MRMTLLALLVFATAFPASAAHAQESDVRVLNRRVEQLERRVAELERCSQALEASPQSTRRDPTSSAPGDWKQLGNWRRLRRGMTMDDVGTLLGQPDRVKVVVLTEWTYGSYPDDGSVTFDAQSQRVIGWSEPRRSDQ